MEKIVTGMERENLYILVFCFVVLFALAAMAAIQETTVHWYVPTTVSHSLSYDSNCNGTYYFVAADNDQNKLIPQTSTAGDTNCQSENAPPITVTNNGTVVIDLNMSISEASMTSGAFLKVWVGLAASPYGCGSIGFGGYEDLCTAVGATDADLPLYTRCVNIVADQNYYVLADLGLGDSNYLCMAADFEGVAAGDTTQHITSGSRGVS